MILYRALLLLNILVITSGSALNSQTQQSEDELLVSTQWLEKNLADSTLVILHYGMKTDFKKEHILGARYISIWDILVKKEQGLRNELPDEQELEEVLRSWGINANSNIIICYQDRNALSRAARLFYTLDYAGLGDQVAILDGGLTAWKEAQGEVSQKVTSFAEGNIDIKIMDEVRISKEEVLASLDKKGVTVVDARPPEQYYGTDQENNSSPKGHIEGAVNIPFNEIIQENSPHLFKTKEVLRTLFEEQGIRDDSTIITYCGTGIWASSIYFTARLLGYEVRFYDGSFQEWGMDESLPITK